MKVLVIHGAGHEHARQGADGVFGTLTLPSTT
jgi:hypothetical protein